MNNKISEWREITDGFRGLRLATYDDIMCGNVIATTDPKVEAALGWLIYNRLVHKVGEVYAIRTIMEAREIWQKAGPANEAAGALMRADYLPAEPVAAVAPEPVRNEEPEVITPHKAKPFQQSLF